MLNHQLVPLFGNHKPLTATSITLSLEGIDFLDHFISLSVISLLHFHLISHVTVHPLSSLINHSFTLTLEAIDCSRSTKWPDFANSLTVCPSSYNQLFLVLLISILSDF